MKRWDMYQGEMHEEPDGDYVEFADAERVTLDFRNACDVGRRSEARVRELSDALAVADASWSKRLRDERAAVHTLLDDLLGHPIDHVAEEKIRAFMGRKESTRTAVEQAVLDAMRDVSVEALRDIGTSGSHFGLVVDLETPCRAELARRGLK